MDMRALYYIYLPSERGRDEDAQKHDEDVKANENCLNQNFSLIAGKIYEYEARLALLEQALERMEGGFSLPREQADTQIQP